MAEISRLENQLSLLTEQLTQLNTTTKEQFKQAKLGGNYNPFSSAYAAPAYSTSMGLDGNEGAFRLDKARGRFNPFSHNRLDGYGESRLLYVSPQDRIRSDTNEVSEMGRKASGLGEALSGLKGMTMGSAAGQVVGAGIAAKLGGGMGAALSTLLVGGGMFAGGAVGAAAGAGAFKALAGTNQRIAANTVHKYMMENSFRFMNPNQSAGTTNPLGAGFGYKDSRELSRNIALMTDDTNLNVKTLMDLTKNFTEGDMMKGVNSTKDFTKRFKDLTETAKTMAYLLNDSIEDAGKFMSDMQLRGFDVSKLAKETAKMKNLSQFLGKDVGEVAQNTANYASNITAGTNMDYTNAFSNQTFSAELMTKIQDKFLKEGDKSFQPGYNIIKNMNGPEEAASVLGKVLTSSLIQEDSLMNVAMMASADYDLETDSFKTNSRKMEQFADMDLSPNEALVYGQKQIYNEYVNKMRTIDPDFEASQDLVMNKFFSNKQKLAGSMAGEDMLTGMKETINMVRKEAPDGLKGMTDSDILQSSTFNYDETTADLVAAAIKASEDGFAEGSRNRGLTALYTAEQKGKNTGFFGKIKQIGAGFGNAVAEVGMNLTSPIQDVADAAIKHGSDFLFGNKDFNYQNEFGMDKEFAQKYFGDSGGYVDPSKIGKDFYEEFEKGLKDAQKKGTVVSTLLLNEVSARAKVAVKESSAEGILSGEDYRVKRWTSKEDLGEYAKQHYDVIQQAAIDNQISDQMLAYVGQTKNMNQSQLKTVAPELKRLLEAYGGNETLAIAASEGGQEALDNALMSAANISKEDLQKMRESKDFTAFNTNAAVAEFSKGYAKQMEKTAGTTAMAWQGSASTMQSKSQSAAVEEKKSEPRDLLMGAIDLVKAGLPRASGESILNARMEAAGIEITPEMSQSEKEKLLFLKESAYEDNMKNLESYTETGSNKKFLELSEEEREKTINTYLSKIAGKDKLSKTEQATSASIKKNYDNIVKGNTINGFSFGLSGVHISEMDGAEASAKYNENNSSTIEELQKEAKIMDENTYNQSKLAHERAKGFVGSLKFEGKNADESAAAKEKFMDALYAGDSAQLERLAKEYGVSESWTMTGMRDLVGAKIDGTDTLALSVDPEAEKGARTKDANAFANRVRYDYEGTKSVLKLLGWEDEDIDKVSISDEKFDKTSFEAIEMNRQDMIDKSVASVAALGDAELTTLINSGLFSNAEIAALTIENGDGNNPFKVNGDGTYSFSGNNREGAARQLLQFASEEYDPGFDNNEQKSKEDGAKTDLNKASSDMLTSVEQAIGVMVEGTKIWTKGTREIAKEMGIDIPTATSSASGATSNLSLGGGGNRSI